ncbi:MAG: aminoglycoside phosphotransferase family protein [Bacilli bacterium]|nr:aminoglycoside phosphotransferase family protein [Bacilli bacterium]
MPDFNLKDINNRICDRSDCFYWQTDRKISVEEAASIWKDRHSAITNDELFSKINSELSSDKLKYIEPLDLDAQTSVGNVNSIRIGVLESGKQVIIRCHPKGVKNGYFYSESLASKLALDNGIPAYKTYIIHDLNSDDDISYQVIEKLPGDSIEFYLKEHPEKEEQLVYEMGKTMAKLHRIKVEGFGPFDNEEAKNGHLVGIFNTLNESMNAGLDENLDRLVKYNILTSEIAKKMKLLFEKNTLLDYTDPVLIHNDFADWNLLTDGSTICGVVDWDECVGGHPIQEIACWSTFFNPERINSFLKGYYSETKKPDNFDELFQLFRLRYTISKMALRIKRYTYEQSPFIKDMIEKGEKHLKELSEIFNLSDDIK